MIEFLLAFPPVLILFLGVIQFALLAVADLVVRHAAIEGVRAAVVVLDDDPQHYDGAPRLQLGSGTEGGPRMAAIRTAVHTRLAAIAPDKTLFGALLGKRLRASVKLAIGEVAKRASVEDAEYLSIATSIVFPLAPGSSALQQTEISEDQIVVRVVHLVPCAVPVVNALLCNELAWNPLARRVFIPDADTRTQRALDDLQHAPTVSDQARLVRSALRFAVVQAEASLPLHAAPYRYLSQRGLP
jgi:hypothetical protein